MNEYLNMEQWWNDTDRRNEQLEEKPTVPLKKTNVSH
jgi:hypothetical protein